MSIIKKTDRMDIFIEEYKNTILIQERWEYQWITKITPWTYTEKRKFHQMADNLIWKKWSGHFKLKVKGTSTFAQKHKNTIFTVNFDIKWVSEKPHWKVNVIKIIPKDFKTSYVDWMNKVISLDTEDTKLILKKSIYGSHYQYQYPIAHEFGHTIGNVFRSHSDEYNPDERVNGGFLLDYLSIMNIGNNLRNRHLDYILLQLNTMFTNTKFQIL